MGLSILYCGHIKPSSILNCVYFYLNCEHRGQDFIPPHSWPQQLNLEPLCGNVWWTEFLPFPQWQMKRGWWCTCPAVVTRSGVCHGCRPVRAGSGQSEGFFWELFPDEEKAWARRSPKAQAPSHRAREHGWALRTPLSGSGDGTRPTPSAEGAAHPFSALMRERITAEGTTPAHRVTVRNLRTRAVFFLKRQKTSSFPRPVKAEVTLANCQLHKVPHSKKAACCSPAS